MCEKCSDWYGNMLTAPNTHCHHEDKHKIKTVERWVNVWRQGLYGERVCSGETYYTKEEAEKWRNIEDMNYIDTIKIQWEEVEP